MKRPLLAALGVGLLATACSGDAASPAEPGAEGPPAASAAVGHSAEIDELLDSAQSIATNDGEPVLAPRYVGNTGGRGIAVRQECAAEARGGTAWPDGTLVRLIGTDDADCAGWSYVAGPSVASWVRDEYLVAERTSGSGSAPGGSAAAPAPLPPNGPMFLYGNASPHTTVGITAAGRFCRQAIVDEQGRWSVAIGPSDECAPSGGDALSFSVNGVATPTVYAYSWVPNGTRVVAF
ncbi:MAG: hypothetical protein O3C25_02965, partial [Chloroflexi bacterium]|nr:hypothetical protein [Chloroflexota bacterium]